MQRICRQAPAPRAGIVHLGLGAFSRAHLCIYTEDAIRLSGGDWGIVGVSLQSPKVRDALAAQQFAYIALQLNVDKPLARQIEVIGDVLVAPENPVDVLNQMAHSDIKIVSLTITEKGYCLASSSGTLNRQHPDIVHDLANSSPVSAPGYLVRALELRMRAGHPPFTVLSCDNLPLNGRVIRRVVLELAREIDPELAVWIEKYGRFPSTMVDRITPATTSLDRESVVNLTGQYDATPVVHEPFSQWVIEDDFVRGEHPDWGSAGAMFVSDVRPYELMKLRMLNATHSALAYLGYLAGFKTIADTVADDSFKKFTQMLWQNEIIPSLTAPPGVSLVDYSDELMMRYSNASIRHLTWQIAMDGSQKLPQRILGVVDECITRDVQTPGLLLAVAAWMHYVGGIDETGEKIDVRDPLAKNFETLAKSVSSPEEWVGRLLEERSIFPAALAKQLFKPLTQTYRKLVEFGAHAMVREFVKESQAG